MTSKPVTKSSLAEKISITVGGLLLLAIVLGGWIPRDCPYFRQALSSCPSAHLVAPETIEQKELARVAHQDITGNMAIFSVKSQDFRGTTDVKFDFWTDTTVEKAYLQVKKASGYVFIALITHPLLTSLNWPRIGNSEPPMSLYQRSETYSSIDQFKANLPDKSLLAVDSIIARDWGLQPNQYTDLDNLTSLEGINYIITSYVPSTTDGSWKYYEQVFDTSTAAVSPTGAIDWAIYKPIVTTASIPFHLGTVHIDYKRMHP
jgi:hypothetical protein